MCFAVTKKISFELSQNWQRGIKFRKLYFSSMIMRYGHYTFKYVFYGRKLVERKRVRLWSGRFSVQISGRSNPEVESSLARGHIFKSLVLAFALKPTSP